MDHVIRTNELIVDIILAVVEEYVAERLQAGDKLIDSHLQHLVSQLHVKMDESLLLLRMCRDRKPSNSMAHASPMPKRLPSEIEDFVKLCANAKRLHQDALRLLKQATTEELASRNLYFDSRKDLPTVADALTFLMVSRPASVLASLIDWRPTAEIGRRVLEQRLRSSEPGAFMLSELFSGRVAANRGKPVSV